MKLHTPIDRDLKNYFLSGGEPQQDEVEFLVEFLIQKSYFPVHLLIQAAYFLIQQFYFPVEFLIQTVNCLIQKAYSFPVESYIFL